MYGMISSRRSTRIPTLRPVRQTVILYFKELIHLMLCLCVCDAIWRIDFTICSDQLDGWQIVVDKHQISFAQTSGGASQGSWNVSGSDGTINHSIQAWWFVVESELVLIVYEVTRWTDLTALDSNELFTLFSVKIKMVWGTVLQS